MPVSLMNGGGVCVFIMINEAFVCPMKGKEAFVLVDEVKLGVSACY